MKKIRYFIFLLAYGLLFITLYLSSEEKQTENTSLFKQLLRNEVKHFEKLNFKPLIYPEQQMCIKKNLFKHLKEIQDLKVNLFFQSTLENKYYLFRNDQVYEQEHNQLKQIIAYRIFKYFDLETPPTFPMTLILTGQQIEGIREIKGTMQEFIKDSRGLTKADFLRLSQEQLDYLVKCEVLDLFLHNRGVELHDIIVHKDRDGVIKKIININRDGYFWEKLKEVRDGFYQYLWHLFSERKISLNPKVGLNLAKRIASTPDEVFIELLSDLPQKEIEKYLSIILKEKKDFDKKYLEYIRILHGFSYPSIHTEAISKQKFPLKKIDLFKQSLLEEASHFGRLRFKLSRDFTEYQELIHDIDINLIFQSMPEGKFYFFKAKEEYNQDYNPLKQIIAYRIFKYFDLETPPTFPMTLILTGQQIEGIREIKGTMQEFIKDSRGLTKADFLRLSQEQLDYLVKCEVLDLFLHNKETDMDAILVCGDKNRKIDKIIIVDKDSCFWDEFKSHLTLLKNEDYHPAYRYLWDLFKKGKINLNPQVGIDLAKRIASTPDEVFIELLSDLPQKDIEKYLSCLLEEKKNFDKKYLEYIKILHGFSIASKK